MSRFAGRVLVPLAKVPGMEPALTAALLLWLPALLAVFGCFNLLGRGGPIWKVLTPISVLLVLLAPFTVPASGSTVAVELLWGVVCLVPRCCLACSCSCSAGTSPSVVCKDGASPEGWFW